MATVIALATGKGGVGKTSLSVNLADLLAHKGHRVLLVDTDIQGDVAEKLGVDDHDGGRGHMLILEGMDWEPVKDVRPRLDVLPAGTESGKLQVLLDHAQRESGYETTIAAYRDRWRAAIEPWDFVVVDTPPAMHNSLLLDATLSATDWLVIPTRHDPSSVKRLSLLWERGRKLRELGLSDMKVAGAILFEVDAAASRVKSDLVAFLKEQLEVGFAEQFGEGEGLPIFDTIIRHTLKSDFDYSWSQQTVREYASEAGAADNRWWERDEDAETYSSAAGSLLGDYQAFVLELLDRMGMQDVSAETGA